MTIQTSSTKDGISMAEVTWEEELPVPSLPEDPAWRENFCFDGYVLGLLTSSLMRRAACLS